MNEYVYNQKDYLEFKQSTTFINAEWGVKLDLFPTEDHFRALVESNVKLSKGPIIRFRDVLDLVLEKFRLDQGNLSNLRFLHAEELKIITKSDYVIFSPGGKNNTYIIQIGKANLVSLSSLGIKQDFQDIIDKIKEIGESYQKYVVFDQEMALFVTEENFNQMYQQIDSPQQITQQSTKVFFKYEALIAALNFIYKKLNEIHQQKYFQIFCEQKYVEYNRLDIKKKIQKIKEEFEVGLSDKIPKHKKFIRDIENLKHIFLIDQDSKGDAKDQVSLVARQLNEYFDRESFLRKGEQIMNNCQKVRDKFTNFLSSYAHLRPNTDIAQIQINKQEIEEFSQWLQKQKEIVRKQVKMYCSQKSLEMPNNMELIKKITECQSKFMLFWQQISNIHDEIYSQRKSFFDERNQLLMKQNKLTKQLQKIQDDSSYVFSVPGKFPEAYRKTIDELQRRKIFNLAAEKLCYLLQRVFKSESKTRQAFNSKYGDYLPMSIQGNLNVEPIEILLNHEEVVISSVYEFIDKIDINKEQIVVKFEEILRMVFKEIDAKFNELRQENVEEKVAVVQQSQNEEELQSLKDENKCLLSKIEEKEVLLKDYIVKLGELTMETTLLKKASNDQKEINFDLNQKIQELNQQIEGKEKSFSKQLSAEIQKFEDRLKEKTIQFNQVIEEKDSIIDNKNVKNKQLMANLEKAEEMKAQLEEKLKNALNNFQSEIDQKQLNCENKIKEMKLLQIKISKDLEDKIDNLKHQNELLQKKIDEKDTELFKSLSVSISEEKKEDLYSSTIEISKKESTIEELKKKIEETEMQFCQMDSEILQKNQMIYQLNDQQSALNQMIKNQKKIIEKNDNQVSQIQQQMKDLQQKHEAQKDLIKDQHLLEIAKMGTDIKKLQETNKVLFEQSQLSNTDDLFLKMLSMFDDCFLPNQSCLDIFLQNLHQSLKEKEQFIVKIFDRCVNTLSILENKNLQYIINQFDPAQMVSMEPQERYIRFEKLIALFEDQIVDQIEMQEKSEMYKEFVLRQMPKLEESAFFNDVFLVKSIGEISPRCQSIFILQDNAYISINFSPELNMQIVYSVELTERIQDDIDTCQRNQAGEYKKLPRYLIAKVKHCKQSNNQAEDKIFMTVELDEILMTSLF